MLDDIRRAADHHLVMEVIEDAKRSTTTQAKASTDGERQEEIKNNQN